VTTRRQFLYQGLGAVAIGLMGPRAVAARLRTSGAAWPPPAGDWAAGDPFREVEDNPPSIMVDGLPFAPWFTGDGFDNDAIPFHSAEDVFPGGQPPAPTESVDVAVIGGGLSGLCTAYLLRQHRPIVFELRGRYGGNSQGEVWRDVPYSLGGAYVITPDRGSFLDTLYRELGLRGLHRLDQGDNPFELNGVIRDDFSSGDWIPADQRPAFDRYRQIVAHYAEESYPDIPLDESQDNGWILALDRKSLREDIEERLGMPIPPLLHAGIQAYCYSSFGAGYEEISAAGGWNFLAAEEYGRWVFPGGNGAMARAMGREIAQAGGRLRAGRRVVDLRVVRVSGAERAQVTWREPDGAFRSLLARRAVVACSKHIAKHLIHDLVKRDNAKYEAMHRVFPVAYFVANVLLEARLEREFYDLFLLRDGTYPASAFEAEQQSRVCDVIDAGFARRTPRRRTVLTLYWPLPWGNSRFTFFAEDPWRSYAERLAPQVRSILGLLGVPAAAVRQVRMTRWGHAFPQSMRNFIADGTPGELLRPYLGVVEFVNQDNWALPAVENSLLDARTVAERIARAL
jgi:hypothetical protein